MGLDYFTVRIASFLRSLIRRVLKFNDGYCFAFLMHPKVFTGGFKGLGWYLIASGVLYRSSVDCKIQYPPLMHQFADSILRE